MKRRTRPVGRVGAGRRLGKRPAIFDHFPLAKMRPGQEEALEAVERAHRDGKRGVIIEAPTGSGKSAIAIAAAGWAARLEVGKGESPGAYILTPQKQLQDQYMRDFERGGLVQLKGRSNYECEEFGDCSVSPLVHPPREDDCYEAGDRLYCQGQQAFLESRCSACHWQQSREEERCFNCPYEQAKGAFLASAQSLTNFAFLLACRNLPPRPMLILDEAHNSADTILNTVSIKIPERQAAGLGLSIPRLQVGDVQRAFAWMAERFLPAVRDKADRLRKAVLRDKKNKGLAKELDSLIKLEEKITNLAGSNSADWFTGIDENGTLIAKPLTAAPYAGRLLNKGKFVVAMSATILDFDAFCASLGLRREEFAQLRLPCTFPLENRPIFYDPVGYMSGNSADRTLPRMAERIDQLLKKYPRLRGLIHTHSYDRAVYLHSALKNKRLILKGKGIDTDIDQHLLQEDSVLIGPAMTEGLDLYDDLSRFQIFCKVPYPQLSGYVEARSERFPGWYDWKTATDLVQASGRSIRSEVDWAYTWILDECFYKFHQRMEQHLPKWWNEALQWPTF